MGSVFRIYVIVLLAVLACKVFTGPVSNPSQLKKVVKAAIAQYNDENRDLELRHLLEVDVKVPDFQAVVPPILGASSAPLGHAEIVRACKLINRIKTIAENDGVDEEISSFLSTNEAVRSDIMCPFAAPSCVSSIYRSYDGSCNNQDNTLWGSAFIPFVRELDPVYESGILESVHFPGDFLRNDLPRHTGVNKPLPSAREVSNFVHASSVTPVGTSVTSQFTAFGQFLSHDITDTPMEKGFKGAKLACCSSFSNTPSCASIDIPTGDFFRTHGRSCMNFARSAEVSDIDCVTGRREQLNIASSFVDGTGIYGHNANHANDLKGEGGLLETSFPNHMPYQVHPNSKAFSLGINMFKSGDEKVSEFTGLTAITTLFIREHNRVAKAFANSTNSWTPEIIFEEARRVVIAIIGLITYKEYLPLVVGPAHAAKYGLVPSLTDGYYTGYDKTINPTLSNGIATAMMRFGHSQVRDTYSIVGKSYDDTGDSLRLRKIYWRTNFYLLFENGFQRGVLVDESEKCDRHMAVDVRNHMFETVPGNGLDLASLNIQRGRDHGLPSYNEFRRLASLSAASEWSTGTVSGFADMDADVVARFQAVYDNPEDLDLWSAGISERPVTGGQVGPLFAELIARQFQKLRDGDRYWFENMDNGFTSDQLNEIRKASLAKLMCNNLPITTIQPRAFELATTGGDNDRVSCDSLPDVDLDLW